MAHLRRGTPPAPAALAAAVALILTSVSLADGGYFPVAWGWIVLGLAWLIATAVLVRRTFAISRPVVLFTGVLALYTAFCALSLLWSSATTTGVENVERDLVYVGAAAVCVALGGRLATRYLYAAVLAATSIVCVCSLATRLFPDRFGVFSDPLTPGRLFNPLGYWNAQGVFAAVALVLAAGAVASRGRPAVRAGAAALVPMLALDCYFTLSRGAILALAVGVGVWLLLDPGRVRSSLWLVSLVPWSALAIWSAHSAPSLSGAAYGVASSPAGHRMALEATGCTILAGVSFILLATVEKRLIPTRLLRSIYLGVCCVTVVAAVLAGIVKYGTPAEIITSTYHGFTARPRSSGTSARIFSVSLSSRNLLWSVAWRDAESHPIGGSGVGSYEQRWVQHRPVEENSRWADSLYLESIAETGVVGVGLLVAGLAIPLVVGVRRRKGLLVPALVGAYTAYLFHAAIDWDWQVPAVTLVAIWCGSAILMADDHFDVATPDGVRRWGLAGVSVLIGIIAAYTLVGDVDLSRATSALTRGDYPAAATDARTATRWQPWSYRPWEILGGALAASGDPAGAQRAYRTAAERDPARWEAWLDLASLSTGSDRRHALVRTMALNPFAPAIAATCSVPSGAVCRDGAPPPAE
jgi:O-Antigen ligase